MTNATFQKLRISVEIAGTAGTTDTPDGGQWWDVPVRVQFTSYIGDATAIETTIGAWRDPEDGLFDFSDEAGNWPTVRYVEAIIGRHIMGDAALDQYGFPRFANLGHYIDFASHPLREMLEDAIIEAAAVAEALRSLPDGA